MAYENIIVSTEGPVTTITLNRPKANALSLDLVKELRAAVTAAESDTAVRVILITGGEGKFFAAGADIPTLQQDREDPLKEGSLLSEGLKTMTAIEECSKPVVAVVNGFALGGGCEICLACHLRIAADTAIFGQPEINLGIIPGWGGTHRLPRLIGEGRANDWLLTGRNEQADEALTAGLVCKVVPAAELAGAAQELAKLLASKPAVATAQTLKIGRERARHPDQGEALEAEGFKAAAASEDATEGIAAFLEKRAPNFTGN
jgi:enoyl-CoA hydratase/carnithine racemase